MIGQPSLFDDPHAVARAGDPQTSWDAARSVRNIRRSQQAVLNVLAEYPNGLIDEDLVAAYSSRFSLPRQSVSGIRTRRAELVAMGLVVDSGYRTTTASGRLSVIWRAS